MNGQVHTLEVQMQMVLFFRRNALIHFAWTALEGSVLSSDSDPIYHRAEGQLFLMIAEESHHLDHLSQFIH